MSRGTDLSFNPDVVEIVGKTLDVSQGTLFVDDTVSPLRKLSWTMPSIDNQAGKVVGVVGERGQGLELTSAYGTLITIHFRAKGLGDAQINLDRVQPSTAKVKPCSLKLPLARVIVR